MTRQKNDHTNRKAYRRVRFFGVKCFVKICQNPTGIFMKNLIYSVHRIDSYFVSLVKKFRVFQQNVKSGDSIIVKGRDAFVDGTVE